MHIYLKLHVQAVIILIHLYLVESDLCRLKRQFVREFSQIKEVFETPLKFGMIIIHVLSREHFSLIPGMRVTI